MKFIITAKNPFNIEFKKIYIALCFTKALLDVLGIYLEYLYAEFVGIGFLIAG